MAGSNGEYCVIRSFIYTITLTRLKRMRWVWHAAHIGMRSNADRILVGEPEGKRSFSRPTRRWEENVNK